MGVGNWIRRRFWGLAVGVTVTLALVLVHDAGWLVPLELANLDFNFRHFNRAPADPRIVLIDINDAALQRIHRWPWPRRMQADLVDVLSECGAEAILLDLVYAEPTPARIVHPALEPDQRYDPVGEVLGGVTLADAVRDDDELAAAIRRAGNVYVAMYFHLRPPGSHVQPNRARIRDFMDAHPDADLRAFAEFIGQVEGSRARGPWLRARIDHLLRRDFGLSGDEIAARLRVPKEEVEREASDLKESAARYLVAAILAEREDASLDAVVEAVLPGSPPGVESPDRRELARAYGYVRATRFARWLDLPRIEETVRARLPEAADAVLPIEPIAAAARRVGFVSFEKDSDGVLRHVPPLAVGDSLVPQIAFALAWDVLGFNENTEVRLDGRGALCIGAPGASLRLPLDAQGAALLNWNLDRADPVWVKSFQHVPAARVMEVALNRRTIDENRAVLRLRQAEAVALMYEGAASAFAGYAGDVRACRAAEEEAREPACMHVAAVESQALSHLERLHAETVGLEPENDEERALFARIEKLHRILIEDDLAGRIERANVDLQARNDELLAELRVRLAGKLCFVGHTAAAQADMVNTPVFENMPGVMAHANLVNMLLTNRIPAKAPPAVNILLILGCGALITLLTSAKGPWITLASVLVLMMLVLAVSAALMWRSGTFVAGVLPAGGIFVTWALVTLYRQLTEERQRRSFARELSRNTSPAIAARITDQLDDLDLTPQPAEVTCYFSDLQGFTTISERLGVEQTQAILNRYLAAMAEVLIARRAFNKFMGDGIFAFFNAPIWPQDQHAVVGCEAALVTRAKLAELKASADASLRDSFAALRMRIGLHTGPVFVGYFGSEHQTDYTCIGDTVNLAARLESANKAFGTQIMVSGACKDAVADRFVFRRLGALQVKGKTQAVPVYELLGRAGEVDDATQSYADSFSSAVARFQQRQWADARAEFQHCRRVRPDDEAAVLYLALIDRLESSPPPEDWNRAVELAAK